MNFLRRLPTRQLLGVIAGAIAVVAIVAAVAVAAIGGGPVPPPKPLDQALQQAINAPAAPGVSARITLTNSLIDTSGLEGAGGNPLIKGADGRLWATNDGRLRLELFSSRGDTQLSIDRPAHTFTFYDGSSNTAYEGTLPASSRSGDSARAGKADEHTPATLKNIDDALSKLTAHANVGPASPTDIAGQPAYSVRITPKASDGGMIGGLGVAWDAVHGVPLDVAVYAKGSSSPVLDLRATKISFGSISAGDLNVAIPPGAKINKLESGANAATDKGTKASARRRGALKAGAQGLAAVRAAVPFTLDAPPSLDNLAQSSVREVTLNGKPAALLSYGQHLGTVFVLERAAPNGSGGGRGISLPTTNINGGSANVLPTALGTIVSFDRNGISYTIAGSVPRAVAEAIARGL